MTEGIRSCRRSKLYEKAYAQLLQKDYDAAEGAHSRTSCAAMRTTSWPVTPSMAVVRLFTCAAVTRRGCRLPQGLPDYARSPKAPESLLKLAMSLQRLAEGAACSSFTSCHQIPKPARRT